MKQSHVKINAIFEISTLENPYIPNFVKIGQTFDFGHFLGDPPPKKPKFFLFKNNSDLNFDVIFEKHHTSSYSKIRCDLDIG